MFQNIFDLFKKPEPAPTPTPAPISKPPVESPAMLPHPEEPMDPRKTVANTNPAVELQNWLNGWNVPEVYWEFWKTRIKLTIYDAWPPQCLSLGIKPDTPAYAVEIAGVRQLNALARWTNPGVIAHEQAHNSYAFLTAEDIRNFEAMYDAFRTRDPYIILLYSRNQYGLSSYVEGHAEVYRYIGENMPPPMKRFYPKLF